ncbi:MAG: hypothetical protein WD426_11575 [Anditalea sp.]
MSPTWQTRTFNPFGVAGLKKPSPPDFILAICIKSSGFRPLNMLFLRTKIQEGRMSDIGCRMKKSGRLVQVLIALSFRAGKRMGRENRALAQLNGPPGIMWLKPKEILVYFPLAKAKRQLINH